MMTCNSAAAQTTAGAGSGELPPATSCSRATIQTTTSSRCQRHSRRHSSRYCGDGNERRVVVMIIMMIVMMIVHWRSSSEPLARSCSRGLCSFAPHDMPQWQGQQHARDHESKDQARSWRDDAGARCRGGPLQHGP